MLEVSPFPEQGEAAVVLPPQLPGYRNAPQCAHTPTVTSHFPTLSCVELLQASPVVRALFNRELLSCALL